MKNSLVLPAIAFLAFTSLSCAVLAEGMEHPPIVADATGQKGGDMPMQGAEATAHDHMAHVVTDLPNGLIIEHPALLIAGPSAKSAAAFMLIRNTGADDDRLIAAEADFADTVGLHTHIMENGIAKMREVEGGFPVEAGGSHELARGGDHIMLMGLTSVPPIGDAVNVILTFEKAGTVVVPFTVIQARAMPHAHN